MKVFYNKFYTPRNNVAKINFCVHPLRVLKRKKVDIRVFTASCFHFSSILNSWLCLGQIYCARKITFVERVFMGLSRAMQRTCLLVITTCFFGVTRVKCDGHIPAEDDPQYSAFQHSEKVNLFGEHCLVSRPFP